MSIASNVLETVSFIPDLNAMRDSVIKNGAEEVKENTFEFYDGSCLWIMKVDERHFSIHEVFETQEVVVTPEEFEGVLQ